MPSRDGEHGGKEPVGRKPPSASSPVPYGQAAKIHHPPEANLARVLVAWLVLCAQAASLYIYIDLGALFPRS